MADATTPSEGTAAPARERLITLDDILECIREDDALRESADVFTVRDGVVRLAGEAEGSQN